MFPKEFKAAPLLRRWIERLRTQGITFKTRHYLKDIKPIDDRYLLTFDNNSTLLEDVFDRVILALGGTYWHLPRASP
jgi:predicted flavoprotein YhiN